MNMQKNSIIKQLISLRKSGQMSANCIILKITISILTSSATPTHLELSNCILELNVWVKLQRSRLKELF